MKKKVLLFITLVLLIVTGCSEVKVKESEYMTGKHHVLISVENYGDIKVELDADTAPITVTNFISLANENAYDGTKFHRIIEGFMIQGGATPKAKNNIKGEFEVNGVTNNINHVRGVISMARAKDYDSASSQFFIVHEDSPHLDGEYAAFGKVIEGMDVVDKIATTPKPIDNNGTILEIDQPVITTIKVLD